MLRRYRAFACLAMTCVGTLLVCPSPAIAVGGEPTAEPLWRAFPLNPTGGRLVETVSPTTEALGALVHASDRDGQSIVSGVNLLAFLCAALIALSAFIALSRSRSNRLKANEDGVKDRTLAFSFIGSVVVAEVLWGYGIYTVVVLLL